MDPATDALLAAQSGPGDHSSGRGRDDDTLRELSYALDALQAEYGPGWYYDPDRWGTADGVVPWPVFLVSLRAAAVTRARVLLRQVSAFRLGRATGSEAETALRTIRRRAQEE